MIFDKNFLKPSNDSNYHVYQEESDNADFVNPYNDSPYLLSSLQKLRGKVLCHKKQKAIDDCLDNYRDDTVEKPEINVFVSIEDMNTTASFADYAKASYLKVLKDLENIQKLIEKLEINEPDTVTVS